MPRFFNTNWPVQSFCLKNFTGDNHLQQQTPSLVVSRSASTPCSSFIAATVMCSNTCGVCWQTGIKATQDEREEINVLWKWTMDKTHTRRRCAQKSDGGDNTPSTTSRRRLHHSAVHLESLLLLRSSTHRTSLCKYRPQFSASSSRRRLSLILVSYTVWYLLKLLLLELVWWVKWPGIFPTHHGQKHLWAFAPEPKTRDQVFASRPWIFGLLKDYEGL
jgi:hypothetical protein